MTLALAFALAAWIPDGLHELVELSDLLICTHAKHVSDHERRVTKTQPYHSSCSVLPHPAYHPSNYFPPASAHRAATPSRIQSGIAQVSRGPTD